jgi:hypothetical protein
VGAQSRLRAAKRERASDKERVSEQETEIDRQEQTLIQQSESTGIEVAFIESSVVAAIIQYENLIVPGRATTGLRRGCSPSETCSSQACGVCVWCMHVLFPVSLHTRALVASALVADRRVR